MTPQQAFTGLRILDFTQVLAGPFATQQLAQLGADVIKVETRETGDLARGLLADINDGMAPSFLTCNLGKRSITLDLKKPQAKSIIFKLVATSDAVVENFKPGTMARLGLDYQALRDIKPDIVYASISGYGQQGPKAELPAFDGAIQAASGMMSISGHPETGPVRSGYFSVDMSTALNAAFAISAALFRRHITGEGQRLDISMMDTAFVMQAPQISKYLTTGTEPALLGNASPTKQPTANVFATQDGFIQVVALRDPQAQAFLDLLGCSELYLKYAKPAQRIRASAEIAAVIQPLLAAQPTAYWLEKLNAAGVPAAAIQTLAQATADEQVNHRLSLTEIPRPGDTGGVTQVVSAGHICEPAPPIVQRPPPRLGEHTDSILLDLGYSQQSIAKLHSDAVV